MLIRLCSIVLGSKRIETGTPATLENLRIDPEMAMNAESLRPLMRR